MTTLLFRLFVNAIIREFDKNITFNIEVYTTQSDERSLMTKWKKNPNIFILTNIVNLLKQSSFIIGSEINTRDVNVETRSITLWWLTTFVNYSSKDFTVPIQKDTEREIFDYIDIDSINKLLAKKDWDVIEEEFQEYLNTQVNDEDAQVEELQDDEIDIWNYVSEETDETNSEESEVVLDDTENSVVEETETNEVDLNQSVEEDMVSWDEMSVAENEESQEDDVSNTF